MYSWQTKLPSESSIQAHGPVFKFKHANLLSPLSEQTAVLISIRSQPTSPEPHGSCRES